MAHHASATAQKRKCPEPEEKTAGMCANRCGFFGAAATGNMCSKCYKEHVAVGAASHSTAGTSVFVPAARPSTAPPEKIAKTIAAAASSSDDASASAVADTPVGAPSVKQQQQVSAANRCAACRKKVGLLGFRCWCEATFCSVHRYSDKHGCGFDYRTAGQEQIAKHNPVVVADKIGTRI